jgi:hypothetical protein
MRNPGDAQDNEFDLIFHIGDFRGRFAVPRE